MNRAILAAQATIEQITPEYLSSLPHGTARRVREIRKALCIMVATDRRGELIWEALERLKEIIQ